MLRNQSGIHSVKVALLAERAVVEYDPAQWTDEKIMSVSTTIHHMLSWALAVYMAFHTMVSSMRCLYDLRWRFCEYLLVQAALCEQSMRLGIRWV